VQHTV
jgi:hypothetical protein